MARWSHAAKARLGRWGAPSILIASLLITGCAAAAAHAAAPAAGAAQAGVAQVGAPRTPTPMAALEPEQHASAAEFGVLLAQTLAARDYATLATLTSPEMRLVSWLGQRRVVEADEVLQDFEELYLGPAGDPYFDLSTDLGSWFGIDPTILWGSEWPVDSVLLLRGLGADGVIDALLAVVKDETGDWRWAGVLVAPDGFGMPPSEPGVLPTLAPTPAPTEPPAAESTLPGEPPSAEEALATPVALLRVKRTTNVYPEPIFDVAPSGLARSGQELALLTASDDGEYLRVACPAELQEPCWVVNDPAAVEVVGALDGVEGAPVQPTPRPAIIVPVEGEGAEEIVLAGDEFVATRAGFVTGAAPREYRLQLSPRQPLYISLSSPGSVANFSVTGLTNGQPYKRLVDENRSFSFVVPARQEYAIRIEAPADQETPIEYLLTVVSLPAPGQAVGENQESTPTSTQEAAAEATLPPTPQTKLPPAAETALATMAPTLPATPTPPATPMPLATPTATITPIPSPEPIVFAPGETVVERTGEVRPNEQRTYVLAVPAGQFLRVELVSGQNAAQFSLAGAADGILYKELESQDNPFIFTSTQDQTYLITIVSPLAVEYLLAVETPALEAATPVADLTDVPDLPEGVARISFEPGESAAAVVAIVPPYGVDRYVVAALEGQEAAFLIRSPESIADFELRAPNGVLLKALGDGNVRWAGVLPMAGDYRVDVYNTRGVRVQYELDVELLPLASEPAAELPATGDEVRISFAPGETSATLAGELMVTGAQNFRLRALAGQTMRVQVSSPQGDVGLEVIAPDGAMLKRVQEGDASFAGLLPATGDYVLRALALGPNAPFELTVTVNN